MADTAIATLMRKAITAYIPMGLIRLRISLIRKNNTSITYRNGLSDSLMKRKKRKGRAQPWGLGEVGDAMYLSSSLSAYLLTYTACNGPLCYLPISGSRRYYTTSTHSETSSLLTLLKITICLSAKCCMGSGSGWREGRGKYLSLMIIYLVFWINLQLTYL